MWDTSDSFLKRISENPRFQELERLSFAKCHKVSDAGVSYICENIPTLKELSLVRAISITDISAAYISLFLTRLTHLNLSGTNKLTDEGVEHIACVLQQNLKLLDISWSQVTDHGMGMISKFKQLEHLGLWRCFRVTDKGWLSSNTDEITLIKGLKSYVKEKINALQPLYKL